MSELGFCLFVMAENKNRWNWEVSGFEPRNSSSSSLQFEREDRRPDAPVVRRYAISAASALPHSSEISKQALSTKVQRLKDEIKVMCFVELFY